MKDAVATQTGIGLAATLSVALAIASHETVTLPPVETEVTRPEPAPDTCVVTGVTDPYQRRALELACLKYGDRRHRFEVFSTTTQGDRRGIFVRLGAFTVAVIFRDHDVELVDKLGEYGRLGNGPDAIRFRDVIGHLLIEVDYSISMGGYTDAYREYFFLDHGRLERQVCLNVAGSDAGARERASEWTSNPWFANDGTLNFSPHYTKRGEVTPILNAYSIPFVHGDWRRAEFDGTCIDPR